MIEPNRLSLYVKRHFNEFMSEGLSPILSAEEVLVEVATAMANHSLNQYIVFQRLMELLHEHNESHSELYQEFAEYIEILNEQLTDEEKKKAFEQ